MTKELRIAVMTVVAALFCAVAADAAEWDRGTLIVRLTPSADEPVAIAKGRSGRPDFERLLTQYQVASVRPVATPQTTPWKHREAAKHFRLYDYALVKVPAGVDPEALRQELMASPQVEHVSYDVVVRAVGAAAVPNDPYFSGEQYGLRNTGTQPSYDPGTAGADINMDLGWGYSTGDSATVLCIIDTGVDFGHPEFFGRLWENPGEIFDEADNDSNGYVDDVFGWNFANDNNAPGDDHGHGTHVAGIAAATGNNGIGVAGVNWNCRIMPVRALGGDGSGSASAVAAGIVYAAQEGADVISMSLGHLGAPVAVESAAVAFANSLGVIVVAAMGNDDVGTTHYPAAYDGVISVGATDSDDRRADPFCYSPVSGSNYGSWIDVCAPGDNVWSTYPTLFGSYANLCGTSMATPHVSGLVSVILGLRPGYPADSVNWLLRLTSDDQIGRPTEDTPGFDIYHGWGRINAEFALRVLSLDYPPIMSAPPTAAITEAETLSFIITASDSNLTAPVFSLSAPVNASLVDSAEGIAVFSFMPDYSQAGNYNVEVVASDGDLADTAIIAITVANGCQCPCYSDPQCDGVTDVIDVINTIGVAFRGAASTNDPDCFPNPGGRSDTDCNGATDVIDVVNMINVAFRGQTPAFCHPCEL